MTTGQRIKNARKRAGLTQADLASKLGIPYQSIGQWERDLRNPKPETLQRLAAALNVDFYSLATWDQASDALSDSINTGSDAQARLDAAFKRLTGAGKKLVADTAEAVAGNPQYQLLYAVEAPSAVPEGNSTQTDEKPPDKP